MTDRRSITEADARALRTRAHGLHPDAGAASVSEAVASVCGLQAQERGAAILSVRPRTSGTVAADVEAALWDDRSVVRTWCMRGTLHLVASDDAPWLLSVLGPHFAPRGPEPKRLAEMGFNGVAVGAAVDAIGRVLDADGPLTRDELASALRAEGVDVDPASRAPNFLIRQAALRGRICEVAPKGGENAYDSLDRWLDPVDATDSVDPADRDGALVELAQRYLSAYQPASREDFAAWSGLLKRHVDAAWDAIAAETADVDIDGRPATALAADLPARVPSASEPVVRLLPGYDTYLLGYAPDNRPVPPEHRSTVWPGAGVVRPTVVVDGVVAATWRLDRSSDPPVVSVDPFADLPPTVVDGVTAEVNDVGRFLGVDPELDFASG